MIECLGLKDQNEHQIKYDEIFISPWASHVDIEEEHRRIYKVIKPRVLITRSQNFL